MFFDGEQWWMFTKDGWVRWQTAFVGVAYERKGDE